MLNINSVAGADMLDHGYFLSEVEVVLSFADSLLSSVFPPRGDTKGTPAEWKIIQHIKTDLLDLQSRLRLMAHFNPKEYIEHLERANKGLEAVRTHNAITQEQYLIKVRYYYIKNFHSKG